MRSNFSNKLIEKASLTSSSQSMRCKFAESPGRCGGGSGDGGDDNQHRIKLRAAAPMKQAHYLNLGLSLALIAILSTIQDANATSIKPADFDRLIMPCYLGSSWVQPASSSNSPPFGYGGGGGGGGGSGIGGGLSGQPRSPLGQIPGSMPISQLQNSGFDQLAQQQPQQLQTPSTLGRTNPQGSSYQSLAGGGGGAGGIGGYSAPTYYGGGAGGSNGDQSRLLGSSRDAYSSLGQQIPRANSMDNFVALLSKIEAASPKLANQPDQLIRMLLGRFRMDNYYYDVRNRVPISGDSDQRTRDLIIPALLSPMTGGGGGGGPFAPAGGDFFPEHLLEHDEKCSMYFMLSHFIDKTTPLNAPLGSIQPGQLTGPPDRNPLRPPSLQAAGSGYPGQSASRVFGQPAAGSGGSLAGTGGGGGGTGGYPGPAPSFGSPATSGMYSYGAGLSNQPDYTGPNQLGQNVLRENSVYQANYNSMRNSGSQYSGQQAASQSRYSTPYLDGQARSRDQAQAIEFGVVTVGQQENAALVLNRVLLGVLAANAPPQSIRQLAASVWPMQQAFANSPRIDEEIDPLFALTLADLWAISSIPKSGKVFDFKLGDNGRWNDTMCPTSFVLERANSIRFTHAELIGGLDGFALGMFRRRLLQMGKQIRLSELLRMYYSRSGFGPQAREVGVCNRASATSTQMDELRRQAENYLRLYQLTLPTSDDQISNSIGRLDSFRDMLRLVAQQFAPQEICADSSFATDQPAAIPFGGGGGGGAFSPDSQQCEIGQADVVLVLDSSAQANSLFMNVVASKLAQRLGLSRSGNTFSVLTNQQDSTGYSGAGGGAYSLNAIVRNSTNMAEIGCALMHDSSRSYQGGQISDPARLMEMFERALINLDTEYLIRQNQQQASSYSRQSSGYVSSLAGQFGADTSYSYSYGMMGSAGPKNTGGAKVIVWFNYGSQPRLASLSSGPTNWNSNNNQEQSQYKLLEAKKYLRENFRGASILAVASNKDDVKPFVFDEDRDIFGDLPPGSSDGFNTQSDPSSSSSSGAGGYYGQQQSPDSAALAQLSGPAEQLVGRLLQRMCDIPALFQYPMCFRAPSENVASVGYITPGKRQYWMMSPKSFFASRSIRLLFKVEGGRLRVCFGRMARPDESAARSDHNNQGGGGGGSITFGQPGGSGSNQITSGGSTSSSNNYYTGLSNGICKDLAPGQEIDFIIDDPCYKKPIAECEPFYFVIKEISNPGDGNPDYMCRDEGCKRFDQVKFTMTHTGVSCSSAFRTIVSSWFPILVSIGAAWGAFCQTKRTTCIIG